MGVLSRADIIDRTTGPRSRVAAERIVICPVLGDALEARPGAASVDVHLGRHFVVTKRTSLAALRPFGEGLEPAIELRKYQECFELPFAGEVTLHPRQFVLASTLEYFRMPLDLTAQVIGRSSWGRAGLIIATATVVHPGYTGIITLEIENLGEAPVTLRVGCSIGQLLFLQMADESEGLAETHAECYERSSYVAVTRPSLGALGRMDSERSLLAAVGSPKLRREAVRRIAAPSSGHCHGGVTP